MGPKTKNINKNNTFQGSYTGGDTYNTNIIILLKDTERKFIVTHNANIKPVDYFTGRETELKELRWRIEEKRKSVLVSGMGGIGKTHICRKMFDEYVERHSHNENVPFQHIGYIEYSGDMGSSLQNCLRYKEQSNWELNQEAAWRELEYLASDGKLLLFVDNVDRPMKEDPGLQRLNSIPGAVVLTSRQASFSDEFEPYRIEFLGTEQCMEIYEKVRFENSGRKVKPEEVQDLEYIIDRLVGRHTITVEFLAHLAWTKHWTVERLRDELEQKGFRLEFRRNGEFFNIQQTYEVLYDLSGLTEAEQNILEAFSIFPYIPLPAETCNQWLLSDAGVSENDDILTGLYQKGWLQFELGQESYAMHPVFAQFIYDKYRPKAESHSGLFQVCRSCLEIPNSGSVLECQKFIPFAENIVKKVNMGKELGQVEFIDTYAYLLGYLGQYKEAEKLYNWCLEIHRERLGEEHPYTVTNYNNLAYVYGRQGKYEKAEELYKKSLRIREVVLGENHPSTADSYNNLAAVYERQGEYEKAKELYEKSLRVRERVLGESNPDTADSYNNLAGVYVSQGEYEKAEELYKKGLVIRERVLGENHPDTATSYNNLAYVYEKQGKYEEAKELYEKSLRIRERVLGESNPDTADSYNNLAGVYRSQGEYEKAEELYKKSLRIRERVLGENHPDTAASYNNLAGVYVRQDGYEKAEELYKKGLVIHERVLGENHPDTATSYNNLAYVYERQGKHEKAEELYKKGLVIHERVFGENHPSTAVSYNNLAGVYVSQGEYEKTEELYKKSLMIHEKVLGENHPDTADSYNNLAGVYERQGKHEKAEELYKKSLRIRERVLGENHPSTADSYNNLAGVYERQDGYEKAEELYKKGLVIRERVLGENHPSTVASYNNLAGVYYNQGKYESAIIYYLKAYMICLFKFGYNHPNTHIVYGNMEIAYYEWKPEGNFNQWLEEKMKE